MKDFLVFWIWAMLMFFWGVFIGNLTPSEENLLKQAKQAIEDCQKDLPRSQVCELTAKVKERKE